MLWNYLCGFCCVWLGRDGSHPPVPDLHPCRSFFHLFIGITEGLSLPKPLAFSLYKQTNNNKNLFSFWIVLQKGSLLNGVAGLRPVLCSVIWAFSPEVGLMSNWTRRVGAWCWCCVTRTAEIEAAELCRTFSLLIKHRLSVHTSLSSESGLKSSFVSHIRAQFWFLIGTIGALIRPAGTGGLSCQVLTHSICLRGGLYQR